MALLSIAFDAQAELTAGAQEYGITSVPLLTDANREVSQSYDVLQWAVGAGEPGHTFVLVDKEGKVAWIRDYGAPENGGSMYVPPNDLAQQIKAALGM